MKQVRVRIAAGLLLAVMLTVGAVYGTVRHICGKLLALHAAAAEAISAGADAHSALETFCGAWERSLPLLRMGASGQALMDLDENIVRLLPLYDAGSDDFEAEFWAVKADVRWIISREKDVL